LFISFYTLLKINIKIVLLYYIFVIGLFRSRALQLRRVKKNPSILFFLLYSICMYFCACPQSTKKGQKFLHFVYVFIAGAFWEHCVARLRIRNVCLGLIYNSTANGTLYYVVYYVCFDKLCKCNAQMFWHLLPSDSQILRFLLPIVLFALLHLMLSPCSIGVFMT